MTDDQLRELVTILEQNDPTLKTTPDLTQTDLLKPEVSENSP